MIGILGVTVFSLGYFSLHKIVHFFLNPTIIINLTITIAVAVNYLQTKLGVKIPVLLLVSLSVD